MTEPAYCNHNRSTRHLDGSCESACFQVVNRTKKVSITVEVIEFSRHWAIAMRLTGKEVQGQPLDRCGPDQPWYECNPATVGYDIWRLKPEEPITLTPGTGRWAAVKIAEGKKVYRKCKGKLKYWHSIPEGGIYTMYYNKEDLEATDWEILD